MKKLKSFDLNTYEKFVKLFLELENQIEISLKFKHRLFDKHYSKKVYENQILFLEWFKLNFDETFKIRLYYFLNRNPCCVLIKDNKNISSYLIEKGKISIFVDYEKHLLFK